MELDEFESGYPTMKLVHLHDVIAQIAAIVDSSADDPYLATPEFRDSKNRGILKQLIGAAGPHTTIQSWRALQGKLGRMKRLNVFDVGGVPAADYDEILKPGRVNIIDVSDSDSTVINNLVISDGLWKQLPSLAPGQAIASYASMARALLINVDPTPCKLLMVE